MIAVDLLASSFLEFGKCGSAIDDFYGVVAISISHWIGRGIKSGRDIRQIHFGGYLFYPIPRAVSFI